MKRKSSMRDRKEGRARWFVIGATLLLLVVGAAIVARFTLPGQPTEMVHAAGASAESEDAHEGHEDHADGDTSHKGREDLAEGDTSHEGNDHADGNADDEDPANEDVNHAGEEEGMRLTAKQRERFGIQIRTTGSGSLRNEVSLPGEIVFNEDRVVHVVPRVPGIAVRINKTVGDRVKAGDTLALIDSAELASAKLDYVAAVTEVGCCQLDLPRAQAIHDNSLKILKLLESSPSVEQLRGGNLGEMGEYSSRLIVTYAEYGRARQEYERERKLMAKKITSEADFLAAESALKKAEAEFFAARDTVAYEVKRDLRDMERTTRLAYLLAETTLQKLRMFGLSDAEIAKLGSVSNPSGEGEESALDISSAPAKAPAHEEACTDPNCTDCEDHQQAGGVLAHNALAAAAEAHAHEDGCTDPNCTDCEDHQQAGGGAETHAHEDWCTDPNCTDCEDHQEAGGGAHAHEDGCTDPNCTDCEDHQEAGSAAKAPTHEDGCTDPNCTDCEDHQEVDEGKNLGVYEVKAPFDGLIVQRHIALGERVGEESELFMIVDTSSVWVNLTVYTKNLAAVYDGQDVVLNVDHSGAQALGKVTMVTPFIDESTRSATARVVLDNTDGRWRPGAFVTGTISTSEDDLPLVVPYNAIQTIEERPIVFIEHNGNFEMAPVTLGLRDRTNVEILTGLKPGTPYVAEGAYQLKATVVTSNLGSHAGHGH
jgi:multidrug efflux pump subunit AcrA (membrane-fusion protein)